LIETIGVRIRNYKIRGYKLRVDEIARVKI